jgi:hypothetical protein
LTNAADCGSIILDNEKEGIRPPFCFLVD